MAESPRSDLPTTVRFVCRAPHRCLQHRRGARPAPRSGPCAPRSDDLAASTPSRHSAAGARRITRRDAAPLGQERDPPLRRHRGPRRSVVRRHTRDRLWPDRSERRGQDDGLQRDHAALHARLRRGGARRHDPAPDAAPRGRAAGHRPHVPEHQPLQDDERRRERHGRRARTRTPRAGEPRGARRRSTSSVSPTGQPQPARGSALRERRSVWRSRAH